LTRAALPHEVEPLTFTGMSDRSGQFVYNGDVLQEGKNIFRITFDPKHNTWTKACLCLATTSVRFADIAAVGSS
jgi:hypothetical protein